MSIQKDNGGKQKVLAFYFFKLWGNKSTYKKNSKMRHGTLSQHPKPMYIFNWIHQKGGYCMFQILFGTNIFPLCTNQHQL